MRIIAQHCFARHGRGDAGPLALVVALPARQDRIAERTGPSELDDTVRNGRAGVEQHAGDLVVPPRNRDLERIFCARQAPGTLTEGPDDGDMTIGRRVPEGHSPAVIASVYPGAAFSQKVNDVRSTTRGGGM